MDNKTCPTCKSIFKYPSRLKIHLQNTIHCKKTPEEITTFFLQFKKKEGTFKCIVCNNNLQELLANNFYENCNEITQINKDLLTIEEKIKVIVETIDNIKNNIDASEHLISSNKNNILDEIYNIIKYYN